MRTERLYLWFGRWRFGSGEKGIDGENVGIGGRSVLCVGFGVFGERTKINKLKKRAKMKAKKRNLSSQLVVSFLPLPTPHIPFALT